MKSNLRKWHKKSDFLKSLYCVYEDYDIQSLLTLRDGISEIIRCKHNHQIPNFDNYKGYVIYD